MGTPTATPSLKATVTMPTVISSMGFANAAALVLALASAAPVPPTQASSKYDVWFGEGCFWERQYAYVMVELNQTGPFNRTREELDDNRKKPCTHVITPH